MFHRDQRFLYIYLYYFMSCSLSTPFLKHYPILAILWQNVWAKD